MLRGHEPPRAPAALSFQLAIVEAEGDQEARRRKVKVPEGEAGARKALFCGEEAGPLAEARSEEAGILQEAGCKEARDEEDRGG
jgi:hypothetical protein